jgi:ribosome-binding protein aMBF1 (putative translation factor)
MPTAAASLPEKVRARQLVQRAVKTGRLVRPDACERCGTEGWVEAHHPDYTKPLDVEWLCGDCHRSEHQAPPTRRKELTPKSAIVGARIREGREALGLSQEAFADRLDTSHQQVGRIERGEHDLRLSTLLEFAAGIGVTAADLLRDV